MPTLLLLLAALPAMALAHGAPSGGSAADTIEPADSKVFQLTYRSFDRFVKKNPLVLMEFYAPWCGHCQQLAPQYRAAAKTLAAADLPTPVVLAKMDDTNEDNRRLRAGAPEMFNFSSYPSLFIIKDGEYGGGWPSKGGKHEWYGGGREAEDIVFHMTAVAKGLDPHDEEKKMRPGLYKKDDDYDPRIIRDLVPEEFDEIVVKDTTYTWIVEFYSDRCPFCKSLAPEMKKASKIVEEEIPGKTRFGAVNSRVFEDMAEKYKITGWPWVACFHNGEKVEDMAGLGGADSVVRWAKSMVDKYKPKGGVSRLSDDFVVKPPFVLGDEGTVTMEVGAGGGATNSDADELAALIDRALEFNILTKKKADKITDKISAGDSTEKKQIKKLKKKLKPLEKALKEAAGSGGGSSSAPGDATSQALQLLGGAAAMYPLHPSRADKTTFRTLAAGLGQHLPCGEGCRSDFQQSLRSPKVGPPRTSGRVAALKWVCRLHNEVRGDDMDCEDAQLALKFPVSKDKAAATKETTGPWDALIYSKDPVALQIIKTQADAWEAQDLEELEATAVEFNLASEKKLAKVRKEVRDGMADQNQHVKKLTRRLAPVLALKDEVKKLKKQLKAAEKSAADAKKN